MILHTDHRTPAERRARYERRARMREAREDRRWKTLAEAGPSAYSAQLIRHYLGPINKTDPPARQLEAWQDLAEALAGALDELDHGPDPDQDDAEGDDGVEPRP